MEAYDVGAWVERATDLTQKEFRAAVHTVLSAVANSTLRTQMTIKGGILMAVRYQSPRYTRDLDFSTPDPYAGFDSDHFRTELEAALAKAVESLDYGLDCRIQSVKVDPKKESATFPTLVVSLGYARKGDLKGHRRLLGLNSSDTVKIDYSFNEITHQVDHFHLAGGGEINAYSLTDLVAEKYRAILQQEVRNRFRRQDAYDLFFLLTHYPLAAPENKTKILASLLAKSASRGLMIGRMSMRQEEIERRSRKDYPRLAQEVLGALPDFQEVHGLVRDFYEALPWKGSRVPSLTFQKE